MMTWTPSDLKVIAAFFMVVGVGSGVVWWKQRPSGPGGPAASLLAVHPHVSVTPKEQQATVSPVDVNTATAEELERVPGIGPVMARRIIRDRDARGPFSRVADLDRVNGIGPKTIARWGAHVTTGKRP